MKKTIGQQIINACWFTDYEDHEDGSVTILKFYRLDCRDKKNWPVENTQAELLPIGKGNVLIEDSYRNAITLVTNINKYTIRNSKNVFSYWEKEC